MKFDVFQIWIEVSGPPSDDHLSKMREIAENIPDGSTYTLISTSNYLSDIEGVVWFDVEDVLRTIIESHPFIPEVVPDRFPGQFKSNVIRYYWATLPGNEHVLHLDCDTKLGEWPSESEIDNNITFFQLKAQRLVIDSNAFYNNGSIDEMVDFFKFYMKELEDFSKQDERMVYPFTLKRLNVFFRKNYINKYYTFPGKCFIHRRGF